MWVACCVTTPAACVSVRSERLGITGPWGRRRRGTCSPARWRERSWGRRSVHRLAKMASRRRSGAFVYTVALRGRASGRWGRGSVHRLAKTASRRRFGAFVYTVALRGRASGRWGRGSVHRSAETASRRRFGAFVYTVASPGCVGWRERRRREAGVFTEASTHTNPEGSESNQCFFVGEER